MASDAYIAAAKKTNRMPTVFMKVEQADSTLLYYTSQGDWEGSDTLTALNTTENPGSIINEKYENGHISKTYSPYIGRIAFPATTFDSYLNSIQTRFSWALSAGSTVQGRIIVCKGDPNTPANILYTTSEFTLIAGTATPTYKVDTTVNVRTIGASLLASGVELFVYFEYYNGSTWVVGNLENNPSGNKFFLVKPTSQLITSSLDFGAVTASNPIFSVDDINESGSSIAYSYTYSTDDISYSSGGTITDGDSMTASRYYKIQADFATTSGGRSEIREIQLSEGLFRYYGTHIDEPFAGVKPYIIQDSVGSLNQKVDLEKGLSIGGEVSVKLQWVKDTSDLIASGYLKGKDVLLYSGFVGLDTDAYEPIMVGTWYDHDLNEQNREITVKIRDAFKQFEKRKVPEESVNNSTGAITNRTLTYTTTSLVTVMKDIFDKVDLRDRYIHPDFDTLEAGTYAANDYKVSRVISKPEPVKDLLNELSITGSLYLIPLGSGEIKPKPFDRNQVASVILDANEINFTNLKGNIKDFYSRFYVYYNPNVTEPSDSEDYDNGYGLIDATAELNWFPEKGTKQHFDKWKVGRTSAGTALTTPPTALINLAMLWNGLFTEPLYTVTARDVPPRYANIEAADVIAVNNLYLPVVADQWDSGTAYDVGDRVIHDGDMWRARTASTNKDPTSEALYWQYLGIDANGRTDHKRFFVRGRKFDPNNALIELDLLEMPYGTIGAFSSDEFSTAFDL